MNELIEQLKTRVGLDDQKARSAAETAINFLKQRLPSSISGQVDSALSGGSEGMGAGLKDKMGDVLGKKSA